jgi:hypothetical protein
MDGSVKISLVCGVIMSCSSVVGYQRQKFGMCCGDCIAWWVVVKVRIYFVVMTLWGLLRCCRRLKFGLWSSGFWHRVFWLVATVAYQTTRYRSPKTTIYIFTALQVSNLVGLCLQPTNATVHTALRTIVAADFAVLGHMLHKLRYRLQLFACLRSTQLTRVVVSLVYACQVTYLAGLLWITKHFSRTCSWFFYLGKLCTVRDKMQTWVRCLINMSRTRTL